MNPSDTHTAALHRRVPAWVRPTVSPEHGVYVVLLVAFLTGAAAAQGWTWATTLAFVCAFCGFQAEHPFVLQIRQRKSLKPRFLLWGSLYGGVALAIALYLYLHASLQQQQFASPLLGIYGGAIAALVIDGVSTLRRDQKSIFNEFITFAAVCLSAPFAYVVTTGHLSLLALGLWVLNTLYFSGTIFLVKLRKPQRGTPRLTPVQAAVVYHLLATVAVVSLVGAGVLPLLTALPFTVAVAKASGVLLGRQWYCKAPIQTVAMIETLTAVLFAIATSLSVLPAHLPLN